MDGDSAIGVTVGIDKESFLSRHCPGWPLTSSLALPFTVFRHRLLGVSSSVGSAVASGVAVGASASGVGLAGAAGVSVGGAVIFVGLIGASVAVAGVVACGVAVGVPVAVAAGVVVPDSRGREGPTGSGVGVTSATAIADSAIVVTAARIPLLTLTVTGAESVVLPTLSVA